LSFGFAEEGVAEQRLVTDIAERPFVTKKLSLATDAS
jgi:hypothetical protein